MTDLNDLPSEIKLTSYSHPTPISDPSLGHLRDQIKKIMIPMLIKIFQFKLELNQKNSLPSRLQKNKSELPAENLICQLNTLDEDLKLLILWCQSSRNQISKALNPSEDAPKERVAAHTPPSQATLAVSKSFSDAVSAPKHQPQKHVHLQASHSDTPLPAKKRWWSSLFRYSETS